MTGSLLILTTIALLIAALAPAHRRAATPYRPGADLSADRDHARLAAELAAAAQRVTARPDQPTSTLISSSVLISSS